MNLTFLGATETVTGSKYLRAPGESILSLSAHADYSEILS